MKDSYEGQINNPLSLNLYTYVENNPLTHTDPSGHCVEDACIGEVSALIWLYRALVVGTAISTVPSPIVQDPPPGVDSNGLQVYITPIEQQTMSVTQTTFGNNAPTIITTPFQDQAPTIIQQPIIQQGPTVMSSVPFGNIGITLDDYKTFARTLPQNPNDLMDRGFADVTDPRMAQNSNRRDFWSETMKLKVSFDGGREGATGFEAQDHYHIYNPFATHKKNDVYLTGDGEATFKGSSASHILPIVNRGN
ncbi:hypothetical protein LOZ80_39070 [Paenibacillus sp. HWE-109]|uniref:hypothetical protein n=1 Tax=Paenibacillus sp. HWE-109 TaxID=1306526 RepID=UPI001EDCA849|nr:hypothetical protein [Paenibacillus sp. HWE-109]UKS27369.1 hypothetical protein LOZ80_39070 [Paenibacillus sp. HWE-109]